jgi:hypothetical protein
VDDFSAFAQLDEQSRAIGGISEAVFAGLFPEQQDALTDPSRFKTYLCPRRSGKSHANAADMVMCSEDYPDEDSLCVSITRGHCRATMGNALERIASTFELPIKPRTLDGRLYYHNERTNHRMWMSGCKDFNEAEKLRGDYLVKVLIDEAQSFPLQPHPASSVDNTDKTQPKMLLQYLVEDVLAPRLLDRRGSLVMTGTPGPLLKGYFWEVTTGDGTRPKWPTHSWRMQDNLYIPDVDAQIAELCRQFGWDPTSPSYQREILGKWVTDPHGLIYRYEGQRNAWDGGPYPECIDRVLTEHGSNIMWVLGVDLGHWDATTFVLGYHPRGTAQWGIVSATGGSELTMPQRAQTIRQVQRELERRGQRLAVCVMDTGGGGKMIAHDLTTTHGIAIEAATKQDKAAGIRLVQADLVSGNLRVNALECLPLLNEWSVLPWDLAHMGHDDRYADHFADATLYLRRALPIAQRFAEPIPTPSDRDRARELELSRHKSHAGRVAQLRQRIAMTPSLSERGRLQDQLRSLSRRG